MKRFFALSAIIAGVLASAAGAAAASASHPAAVAKPAAAVKHMKAAGTAKARHHGEGPKKESDGPGGHQDPDGQNVNHQFQGVE